LDIPTNDKTFLERSRIRTIFAEAMQKPLVVVSAGAGYGKTSAVYSFLRDYDATSMWFQLSERDNVGARFWETFTHTLSLYNKNFAEKLLTMGFPETKDLFEKYVSMLEENVPPGKRVLVYDDFHLIRERSVFQFVERSIKFHFPDRTTILISRTDPSIDAVRLLSRGMAFFVGEDDLRLTEVETSQYFLLRGLTLSPQSVADIYGDTRGWVFAMNLLSLSLKKFPSREQGARIAMKLNIFKMIENEVYLVSSERLQRLLIQLSLIDNLSAELVYIIAGGDETLIGELEKLSSFVRLDIYSQTYFIHHLFLDYLRQKQNALTEEEKKDVYLKAARWCDENDYKIDAISYYERAGEYGAIVDIVYSFRVQYPYDQARFIIDVYDRIPSHSLECHIQYHRQYATLLMSLGLYEETLTNTGERIEKYSALPASDFNNQVLCVAHRTRGGAQYLMAPRTDRYDFYESFKTAEHYYRLSPYKESAVASSITLSAFISKVGTTRRGAMEEFIDALALSVPLLSVMLNGYMSGLDDLARGELQFYKGALNDSVKFLRQALRKAETFKQYEVRNRSLFYLLRIAVAKGDFKEIQTVLEALKAQLEMKDYHSRFTTFDIVSSWYYSLINQPNLVAHWISNGDFDKGSLSIFKADFGDFIKAKFYYSDRRHHELISFVETKPVFNEALFGKLEMKLLTAVCQYHLKNRDASMNLLREAYELASSNDLMMPFIELGKDMRTLTRLAMQSRIPGIPVKWLELVNRRSATYAKRLLSVMSEYKKANKITEDVRLSVRETEVLQDLYDGLSRAEIAAHRELSISTVKTVLNAIYTKLGANTLADVIRIAISQNLIKPR
jgi:LuxR family maltose regulon positive regulatory protein